MEVGVIEVWVMEVGVMEVWVMQAWRKRSKNRSCCKLLNGGGWRALSL